MAISTCKAPIPRATVGVLRRSALLCWAASCWLVHSTSAPAQCSGPTFEKAWSDPAFATGTQILSGDFRGTGGRQFLVVYANGRPAIVPDGPVTIAYGNARAFWTGTHSMAALQDPYGRLALVTASGMVLYPIGTTSFFVEGTFAVGDSPRSLALGDFDGDGILDVAVVTGRYIAPGVNGSAVVVSRGTGMEPTFSSSPKSTGIGDDPWDVAVGDLDGDGKLDLVTADHASDSISFLKGAGNLTFSAHKAIGTKSPTHVTVADINLDSHLDVIVFSADTGTLELWLGDGTGQFTKSASAVVAFGGYPWLMDVADMNGDGYPDILAPSLQGIRLFLGNAHGLLGDSVLVPTGDVNDSFAAVLPIDLDGDHRRDFVAASNYSSPSPGGGYVNHCFPAPPTLLGDANGDGLVDVSDVFYLINYLFGGGALPSRSSDVNSDGTVDIRDVFYLINALFAGGPAPGASGQA